MIDFLDAFYPILGYMTLGGVIAFAALYLIGKDGGLLPDDLTDDEARIVEEQRLRELGCDEHGTITTNATAGTEGVMNDRLGELSHEMAEDIRQTMHRRIGDPFGGADDGPTVTFYTTYAPRCLIGSKPRWSWQQAGLPVEPPSRYAHDANNEPAWLKIMEAR